MDFSSCPDLESRLQVESLREAVFHAVWVPTIPHAGSVRSDDSKNRQIVHVYRHHEQFWIHEIDFYKLKFVPTIVVYKDTFYNETTFYSNRIL